MIVAHFDLASLANLRLSPSPAAEVLSLLELAASDRAHPVFGDPGASARFALRDPDVAMIGSLVAKGWRYLPDLLLPQPGTTTADGLWATQLERVAATPAGVAAEQMSLVEGAVPTEVRQAVESGEFAGRVARGFDRFWHHAARDMWPRVRDRVQADLAARAKVTATAGVGAMLDSLHPKIRWTGSALEVHKNWIDQSLHYEHRDVVLVPSVLSWPKLNVQFGTPDTEVIMYPARAFGDVGARDGVSRLVGPTRARLLRDLDVPRSTSDLSRRHRLAPATVSYHLSVLHGSGLVTKSRDQRSMLYRRTDVGDRIR